MDVQVLGSVRAWQHGAEVALGPTGQRAVLGLLALAAGQPVQAAELVDALWPDHPPPSAANVVQTRVKLLRQLLEPGRRPRGRSEILPSVGGGYALRLPAENVDVTRFRLLVDRADRARSAGDLARAGALLGQALRLWRGRPLADVATLAGHPKVVGLVGVQHAALGRYAEVMIAAGAAADAIPILAEAAAAHPLDEGAQARLIRAYHAAGKSGPAVAHYHRTRRRLADELGVDPGPDLVTAHAEAIGGSTAAPSARDTRAGADTADGAAAGSAVDTGGPPAAAGPAVPPAPAQLPADVRCFTGRAAELPELDRLVGPGGPADPTSTPIVVIAGTAGVGKTALAVHWAHRVRHLFPDGQLYVNLRGYDRDQPLPAADALAGFLRALEPTGTDIPPELAERAARFRTAVSGRRLLILLDNAGNEEQVRPLLPGSPTAAVVATSRHSLAGLVALQGAHRLDLDLLSPVEAVDLMHQLVGSRTVDEPVAAGVLAEQCARLPLALRVAAELANARPDRPLADLVDELADRQQRLDLLDAGGDARGAVQAVFSWSYQHLAAPPATAFRRLSLHPGTDLDGHAAAALVGTPLREAGRLLDALARAHLVQPVGTNRYAMHDLLTAYGAGLAAAVDGEDEQEAALVRLFDYYLGTAAAAVDAVHPASRHRRPRVGLPATPTPPIGDPAAALEWLELERTNLVAMTALAARRGWSRRADDLGRTLYRYLDVGGYHSEAITIHGHAHAAADRAGDPTGMAHASAALGVVHFRLGRYGAAVDAFREALDLYTATGDRAGEAQALINLGILWWREGRSQAGTEHLLRARAAYRELGDRVGEARTLSNLGLVYEREGRHRKAIDHHRRALALFRELGDRAGEAHALANLGSVWLREGRPDRATEHYQNALIHFREIADRRGEADALNGLGESFAAAGRSAESRGRHEIALAVAVETGDRYEEARANRGLGHAEHAAGRLEQARRHWHRALGLFTDLGLPDAAELHTRLSTSEQVGSAAGP